MNENTLILTLYMLYIFGKLRMARNRDDLQDTLLEVADGGPFVRKTS